MSSPTPRREASRELRFPATSGWLMLTLLPLYLLGLIALIVWHAQMEPRPSDARIGV